MTDNAPHRMIDNHSGGRNGAGRPALGSPRTAVDRVLACLQFLAADSGAVGLDEISKSLDLPKSSTHRALASLVRAGLVEQDDDRRYRLGLRVVRLALSYYEGLDRPRLVQPVLTELAEMIGETAHYAELDEAEVVYLGQARPPGDRVQMTARIGGRIPAYCTSLGKAMLAYLLPDRAAVTRFVELHGPLAKLTPNALTSATALTRELQATRERGYAVDREESDAGITCVAFPIFLGGSKPTAAISVSALASRTRLEDLIASIADIRGVISANLGEDAVYPTGHNRSYGP